MISSHEFQMLPGIRKGDLYLDSVVSELMEAFKDLFLAWVISEL